jgi:hypothetical protein
MFKINDRLYCIFELKNKQLIVALIDLLINSVLNELSGTLMR